MSVKIAINGYGRIGRNILRAFFERELANGFELVAVNSLGSPEQNMHLTKYDTTHGPFKGSIELVNDNDMIINGRHITMLSERNPEFLPWAKLDVDIVLECSGYFTEREKAALHLKAGAKKVIISAPGKNADATVVYGVNDDIISKDDDIISNASCTTNCLAPIAKVLNENIGIESGMMVTVHSYTNDQVLIDANHSDLRRARSATSSIIPTKTGAAKAVGLVIPELNGKLDGYAMRVPTINVSVVDLTFVPKAKASVEAINKLINDAALADFKNVIAYNDEPLVSADFNHNPASSIFDATQTRVLANQVKVVSWYDNEWGFSNRMLDVTAVVSQFV